MTVDELEEPREAASSASRGRRRRFEDRRGPAARDGTVIGAARIRTREFEENGGPQHMTQVLDAVRGACQDAGIVLDYPVADLGVYCLAE